MRKPYQLFPDGSLTLFSLMLIFFPMGAILCDLGKVYRVPWAKYQGDVAQGMLGTLGKVPR
ncbi:MAG: hypothetical protein RBS13_00450 [Bacteroidales bacterium]|nr:hypothetical protein [Bacteroidales bacterium]